MTVRQFNALFARNHIEFGTATSAGPTPDLNIMPNNMCQHMHNAKLGTFYDMCEESGIQWFRSAQTKLEQVSCNINFWIA